ncbi:hypothetical protein ACFSL6_08700 [Paenibacillus thailandensis]|uniref:Uncharacterized protein n=1 Tax=Paenibacillus thailandensis TaxID=393250 RepID=A0ABW5QTP5_9BACL
MSSLAPIVAFVGTTPNIGTTVASFAAAYRMAEKTEKPVGYFCLHLKSAKIHRYLGIDEPEVTLDRLRADLRSGSLTADKLLRSMHRPRSAPALHVLFGNMARDQAEYFTPEEAEHLIACAEEIFSIVVLDAGAYWDNAATIIGLRRAGTRILVTTPALSHFQEDGKKWISSVSPLFGIEPSQYETIVIQSPMRNGGYRVKEICKELGTMKLGELRLEPSMFASLDSGSFEQWLSGDAAGKQAMGKEAETLMNRYGLVRARHQLITAQPWYRKLLEHRGGVGS